MILSIDDVGNDQGRQVRLTWEASRDHPGITQYIVFRKIGAEKTAPLGDWDLVAVVPEVGLPEYNLVVPTLCDSTISDGLCESTFFIRATTDNALDTFDSPFWSGYSVDNLVPSMPSGLALTDLVLTWIEPSDPDIQYYSIYGGSAAEPDGSEILVGHATGTSFDISGNPHSYFHVSATDFSGNEGPSATVGRGVSGTPGAAAFRTELLGNVPNPFNPSTRIVYNLETDMPVHLSVYDISGRLIQQLERGGAKPAGRYETRWDGRDSNDNQVAAGIYFCHLEAGSHRQTMRMALLK